MPDVRLTIHRSAHEIGGNCLEIATSNGHRLILDAGRPLDAPETAKTGLVPQTLDIGAPVEGVLLSHPHQDHYGLLGELPSSWPVYCGSACEKLVRLTSGIFGGEPHQAFSEWQSGIPMGIGPFTVAPYLTDHSAFDAYMLLVDVHGRRLLYSGDFRMHGRKGSLVRAMMARPPPGIDVLIMEGTNLNSNKPCATETAVEGEFSDLFRETAGRVFVSWSAQNVDRTVTLYRACVRTGRTLVVDLYSAEILEMLASHGRLPRPGWRNLKVVVTSAFARMYRKKERDAFVSRMAKYGIAAKQLAETPDQWVVMTRPSLIGDYSFNGVHPTPRDAWSWSMWSGYLQNENGRAVQAWFDAAKCPARHIHTSGHSSHPDLLRFAAKMNAKALVPIHGTAWDSEIEGFSAVRRLADGVPMII